MLPHEITQFTDGRQRLSLLVQALGHVRLFFGEADHGVREFHAYLAILFDCAQALRERDGVVEGKEDPGRYLSLPEIDEAVLALSKPALEEKVCALRWPLPCCLTSRLRMFAG